MQKFKDMIKSLAPEGYDVIASPSLYEIGMVRKPGDFLAERRDNIVSFIVRNKEMRTLGLELNKSDFIDGLRSNGYNEDIISEAADFFFESGNIPQVVQPV